MTEKSALLVEDDPFLIDIYSVKLKEAGFLVEVEGNGENVIKRLKEKKSDILILDLVLPKVDGWEILRMVKEDGELKDLPVIILSNLGQKEDVEKGLKLGAAKYLIKAHYTPSEVVREIEKLFKN